MAACRALVAGAVCMLLLAHATGTHAQGRGRGVPGGPGRRPPAPTPGVEEGTTEAVTLPARPFHEAIEAFNRGRGREALAAHERAAAEAEARGTRAAAARAHGSVAALALRLALYQPAIRAGDRALELLAAEPQTVETVWATVSLRSMVAAAYRQVGEAPRAREHLEAALALAQGLAHVRGATQRIAGVSRHLAELAHDQGDATAARRTALDTTDRLERQLARLPSRAPEGVRESLRRHLAEALALLARVETAMGLLGEAEATIGRARAYARLVGHAELETELGVTATLLAGAKGDHRRAVDLARGALAEARRLDKPGAQITLHHHAARALLELGRAGEALESMRAALDLVEEVRSGLPARSWICWPTGRRCPGGAPGRWWTRSCGSGSGWPRRGPRPPTPRRARPAPPRPSPPPSTSTGRSSSASAGRT